MEDGQWYWSHLTGQLSFLGGPLEMIQKRHMEEYMENRDRTQTDHTNLYFWKTVNTGWTSRVWSLSMRSFAEVGLIQRLIFDWHWDGRNATKGLKYPPYYTNCWQCGGASGRYTNWQLGSEY